MKLVITDTKCFKTGDKDVVVVKDNGTIKKCAACYGCWIKTPGQCVIKDGYDNMAYLLGRSDEVVIISRCVFGSYSPFVKNVLDRSIPYMLADFSVDEDGRMYHKVRYDNEYKLKVYFYDAKEYEKETAKELVKRNAQNFGAKEYSVSFIKAPSEMEAIEI